MNILEIKNLSVEYPRRGHLIRAARGVSLDLVQGETLALVGESGSGKSTVALSLLGLIFENEGKVTQGEVFFKGTDLLRSSLRQWQALRCKDISIVFQDPFSALNPVLTIEEQLVEAVTAHAKGLSAAELRSRAQTALDEVMLHDHSRILASYPHQLSGGQRQRIAIAIAIINRPQLLIADEPTTALDVTIQKEILDLLDTLKKELSLTVLLITHNLPLAWQRSQRIAVMYAGEIVEEGTQVSIFSAPLHPYTKGLINSVPQVRGAQGRGAPLSGQPPDLSRLPQGCAYAQRPARSSQYAAAIKYAVSSTRNRSRRERPYDPARHQERLQNIFHRAQLVSEPHRRAARGQQCLSYP